MNRNVTAVILIILAIGVYLEFTDKVWTEAKAVSKVNDTYITAISNAERLIAKRDQILNEYNSLSTNDQDRLNKMVPTSVDNIRLIIDLNSVALRRGMTLHGIKAVSSAKSSPAPSAVTVTVPGDIATQPIAVKLPIVNLDTVSVSFSTTATYAQFIQFLRDLEANLHIMDLSQLKVVAHDNGVNDYTVELKTYWLKQQ